MTDKDNGSFWPSYVDIMTTLFAITLVLFAVSFSKFKTKQKQLEALVDEYDNIVNVYSTVNEIDKTEMFRYNSEYQKHIMTIDIQYQQKEYSINKLKDDIDNPSKAKRIRAEIKKAGQTIEQKINALEDSVPKEMKKNIKFLIVIEGQSSKIGFGAGEDGWRNNNTLSYLRAMSLAEYWKANGIDFADSKKHPRCELLIAGSGEGGKPRVETGVYPKMGSEQQRRKWIDKESQNQRFLVNIVPVIGNIDVTKEKVDKLKGKHG